MAILMVGPQKLREWREAAGLSQAQAAKRLGIAQGTWSTWERGDKRPELEFIFELEKATKRAVRLADWIRSDEEREKLAKSRGKLAKTA
jgi:transcriptional regulator with XRE-family HTH domain